MTTIPEPRDELFSCAPMSRTTSSSEATPMEISPMEMPPAEMSPLEGLEGADTYQYKGVPDLKKKVDLHSAALREGIVNQQFVVFLGVKEDDLQRIKRQRPSIGRHTRISYYTESRILVIKLMPSIEHEGAHLQLSLAAYDQVRGMGIPRKHIYFVGAADYEGPHSSKEGMMLDGGWRILTVVIVISVKKEEKKLVFEKWCSSPNTRHRPATRRHPNPNSSVPTMMHELAMVQNPSIPQPGTTPPQTATVQIGTKSYNVTGAPLTIEFDSIFLRPPVPPNEHDLVFDATALADVADDFWIGLRL